MTVAEPRGYRRGKQAGAYVVKHTLDPVIAVQVEHDGVALWQVYPLTGDREPLLVSSDEFAAGYATPR